MAVKIRLRRMGARNRPFYRFVVADSRARRDGRFLEMLGYYDPVPDPVQISIDEERVINWLNEGAQLSDSVRAILKKQGILDRWKGIKRPTPSPPPPPPPAEAPAEPVQTETPEEPPASPETETAQ